MIAGVDGVPVSFNPGLAAAAGNVLVWGNAMEQYTIAIKTLLDGEGVSIIQYPFYLSFGHEIAKIKRTVSGETAAIQAAIVAGVYVARGLTLNILNAIKVSVFNIEAPAP